MVSQKLYRNDLYLSILWNPHADKTDKLADFFKRLGKAKEAKTEVDKESIRKLEDVTTDIIQNLQRYGAKKLSLYEHEGNVFSQQSEFIHQLVGGRRERIPLTWGTIASSVYSDRLIFGKEIIEIRYEAGRRFAGMFGWKEYPAKTKAGMTDGLLTLPFEFIFTQSFVFKSKTLPSRLWGANKIKWSMLETAPVHKF
ncbi:hypothetical protein MCW_00063 [Cardidatus Bartonella washoeensis 085-0475]|uniref:CagE TrbE VirB component of type IV transporter system central domain-containing protein n=1 Tax=Cardidatus Bartonella washoeensis 085-0475 TaxID=1094564 RepID=J1JR13_9HYPH|nr:hypothetical protein MCW_00063 [Bartonella washoeensis 085-0475]